MNIIEETTADILPPNPIRVETALSRYPVHRLAKHGDISININEKSESGERSVKWEVDYSKRHGQPGPLAYKLDTLIINRRIEEAPRPIPRIIKLGTLRDLCRELGQSEGENVNTIRNALRQNAFAGITARIRYRQNDGTERTLEADFTRYSVVFTGEELPDGRKADGVYIVLNDIYMQVINGAMTRPLDYDYLKSLPPASQRFYELLSYRMYAAIKNDRPRARLVYSEFCTYAPQTRHLEWERVRSQMNKVYRPHKESGYLAKIDYEQTADSDGQPDWIMLYQPGPKARAEYRAFTKRGGPVMIEAEPFADVPPALPASQPTPQEAALIGYGISPPQAGELARKHDMETINTYIEYLEWEKARKPEKIKDDAAWLYTALRDGRRIPKTLVPKAERQRQEEKRQTKERQDAEAKRREREKDAAERAEKNAIIAYWEKLTPKQQAELQAKAEAEADPEALKLETGPLKSLGQTLRRHEYIKQHNLHNQHIQP